MATDGTVPLTAEGRDALLAELDRLREVRRPEIVHRIAHTRAEGDLTENAGYHQAREDLAFVDGRIATIEGQLRNAVLIEEGSTDGSVRLGSSVVVRDEHGEASYRIVGPAEVDITAGRISGDSPVGRALMGARAGDTVHVEAPGGRRAVEVVAVS